VADGRDPDAGRQSRWSAGKDLFLGAAPHRARGRGEDDHLQGDRFRHATVSQRWVRQATADCRFDQLEVTPPAELAEIFPAPFRGATPPPHAAQDEVARPMKPMAAMTSRMRRRGRAPATEAITGRPWRVGSASTGMTGAPWMVCAETALVHLDDMRDPLAVLA